MILIVAIALHSLSPVILSRISAIVFIYAGVLAFNTFDIQAIGSGIGIYSGLFQVSTVSQLFDIFLFFIAGLILIASPYLNINMAACHSVEAEKIVSNNNSGQYSLIVLFSTLGASLLISSFDLISLYLCIELQSFGVYILATLYRNSESATSAGLKYFLLVIKRVLTLTYKILNNFKKQFSFNNNNFNYLAYLIIAIILIISINTKKFSILSFSTSSFYLLVFLISILFIMFINKKSNRSYIISLKTLKILIFYSIIIPKKTS